MKKYIFLLINISLLLLLIPSLKQYSIRTISFHSFYYSEAVELNDYGKNMLIEQYSFDESVINEDIILPYVHISDRGTAKGYLSEYQVEIELPFSCYQENDDFEQFLVQKQEYAEQKRTEAYKKVYIKVSIVLAAMILISVAWLYFTREKKYSLYIYCILTIILLILVINNYWIAIQNVFI